MPTMRAGTKRRVRLFLGVLFLIAMGGAALGSAIGRTPLIGALVGVINGVIVLGGIVGAEIFLPQTRLGQALERAPFLVTFAVKWLEGVEAYALADLGPQQLRGRAAPLRIYAVASESEPQALTTSR